MYEPACVDRRKCVGMASLLTLLDRRTEKNLRTSTRQSRTRRRRHILLGASERLVLVTFSSCCSPCLAFFLFFFFFFFFFLLLIAVDAALPRLFLLRSLVVIGQ